MDAATVITTIVTALVTASIGGGIATLLLLPRQKRHLDATIEQTRIQTANTIIDQLQEEVTSLRTELLALRLFAAEERRLSRQEIDRLNQLVVERDERIRQLLVS